MWMFVLCAPQWDLLKEVDEKNFRLDLYHRLSVIIIHVPSLNERKDDIPLLIDKFLQDICNEYGIARKGIDEEAIRALQEYNWTGNIRELRNVVERLIILSSKSISREDVASYVLPKIAFKKMPKCAERFSSLSGLLYFDGGLLWYICPQI
jgi:DNA-binding NtrC family response regulator